MDNNQFSAFRAFLFLFIDFIVSNSNVTLAPFVCSFISMTLEFDVQPGAVFRGYFLFFYFIVCCCCSIIIVLLFASWYFSFCFSESMNHIHLLEQPSD